MNVDRTAVARKLLENPLGFTISELATKMSVSRHTIANILAYFEGAKLVDIRQVGMAKIYHVNGNRKRLEETLCR